MSDPLSIAASVAGVATIGFAIAKAIRQIADSIGNAGREILSYGEDIDAFARLLDLIRAEILSSLDYQYGPAIFEQVRQVCSGVLEPFHKLQRILTPLVARFKSNTSRFDQFCTKLQWVFEKKREMLFYRDNLRLRHSILDTALLVLISHNNRDGRAQTVHVIETSIDKSLKELQSIADESASTVESLKLDWQQTESLYTYETDSGTLGDTLSNTSNEIETNSSNDVPGVDEMETSTKRPELLDTTTNDDEQVEEHSKPCTDVILRKKESDPDLPEENLMSEAELDDIIDSSLDPDDGKSIRRIQLVTATASQKMLEISTVAFKSFRAENKAKGQQDPADSPNENNYMIAIVCSFSFELAAMKSMLNKWSRTDPKCSTYVTGTIGTHSVVIYCLPHTGYGNPLSFETYNRIYKDFPKVMFTFSLGIAEAYPTRSNDIRLGDVVVGRPNLRGDSVLLIQNYDSYIAPLTKVTPKRSYLLPDVLQSAVESLRAEYDMKKPNFHKHIPVALRIISSSKTGLYNREGVPDRLFKPSYEHPEASDCLECEEKEEIERPPRENPNDPEVHFGVIASCDVPIDNANDRDWFGRKISNLLCFESEGAEISTVLPCLVVRGISGYADTHKSEIWQRPAALAAAAYIRDLILWLPKAPKA